MSIHVIYHGHSFVEIEREAGSLLIDPFIEGNRLCDVGVEDMFAKRCLGVIVTHGHADHVGQTLDIVRHHRVPLYAQYELANFFEKQGLYDQCVKASVGGTIFSDQFALTCVIAHHGGSIDLSNGSHYCQPVGWVVTINGKKIYHAGDTALTMDMKLLGEGEQIDVAALPIGDVYTMGVQDAVKAVGFIKPKIVFPIHFDTFEKIKADAVGFAGCVMQQSSTVPKVLRPGQYIIID